MECEICLEKVSKRNIITCPYCQMKACNKCVKEYLSNYGGLECSGCKKKINITFIANHFTKKWLKDDYPKQYSKFCLLSEDTILNELNDVVNIYNLLSDAKYKDMFKVVQNHLYLQKVLKSIEHNNIIIQNILFDDIYKIINGLNYVFYEKIKNNYFCFLPCLEKKYISHKPITREELANDLNITLSNDKPNNFNKISYLDILLLFNDRINNIIKNNPLANKILENKDIFFTINENNYYNQYNLNIHQILYQLIYNKLTDINILNLYKSITDTKEDVNKILKFYNSFKKKINNNTLCNKRCINNKCRGYLKEIKDEITEEEFNKHNNKKEKDIEDYRYIKKTIKERNEENYITKYYKINYLVCKLCNMKVCYDCNKEICSFLASNKFEGNKEICSFLASNKFEGNKEICSFLASNKFEGNKEIITSNNNEEDKEEDQDLIDLKNHKCNPDDLANISAIRLGAKSCPGCGIPIFKSEGCDHMFCISCHCMFNWSDLKITKTTTNPLYYEWLRSRGITPERSDRREYEQRLGYCDNNMYNSTTLNQEIKKYNIIEYDDRYFNLGFIFEKIQNYPSRTIDEYNKVRLKYLLNMLSEEEYKKTISKYDIEFNYINEFNDIYNTFRFNINDILHDLFNKLSNEIDEENKLIIIKENAKFIDDFIKDFNKNMDNYKKLTILNKTVYLIDNNWLIYEHINHLDNTISKLRNNLYIKSSMFLIHYYLLTLEIIHNMNNNYDDKYKDKFDYLMDKYLPTNNINKFKNDYNKNKEEYDKIIKYYLNEYNKIDFDKCISGSIIFNFYSEPKNTVFKSFVQNLIYALQDDIIEFNNENIRKIFIKYNNIYYSYNYKLNYSKLLYNFLNDLINELKI